MNVVDTFCFQVGQKQSKFLESDIEITPDIEYLTNKDGDAILLQIRFANAVVIPIDLWRQLLPIPTEEASFEELQKAVEDYCLNTVMDEAVNTPLLTRFEALAQLEE